MIQILFWNNKWQNAQWGALCTKITEVNLFAFAYRLFHEDFSSILRAKCLGHASEIFCSED